MMHHQSIPHPQARVSRTLRSPDQPLALPTKSHRPPEIGSGPTSTQRECATDGAGDGTPTVFLHGWAPHRSYQRALFRLAQNGTIVYAPRLPRAIAAQSFRSIDIRRLSDYVCWLDNFLTAIGIDTPFTLVGHSVGGAIAIKAAYETPDRVAKLVLVNALGGAIERQSRPQDCRPSSALAPEADLTQELQYLAARQLPVALLWGAVTELFHGRAISHFATLWAVLQYLL
ncbi:alpha/beta hydrolase [Rhodococcus opacus]|nr:alpha/beta hydrolase [Rhodococcus opacus]